MKQLLFIGSLLLSLNAFSRSPTFESDEKSVDLVPKVEFLEYPYSIYIDETIDGLKIFFTNNKESIQNLYPEFKIEDLLEKIKQSKVLIVNEVLIDKNGMIRTCLNYPDLSVIKCSIKDLEPFFYYRESLFVILLHEFLGLTGVEENSIEKAGDAQEY